MLPFALPERYARTKQTFKGGQGTIVVCEDRFLKRQVAIKALEPGSNPGLLRTEIRALSSVRSRHVVEVYDVITNRNGEPVGLVEEFVSGPTLEEYVKSSPEDIFLSTMWQLASGVADIHQCGKIHRDLNPMNVKLDSEGVMKILDFGLSMDATTAETVQRRGTYLYAAPELFGIPPVTLTTAADVYSLGVLAWFIAQKGTLPPFLNRMAKVKGSETKSIVEALGSLPQDIVQLLDSTLSTNPLQRPTSASIRDRVEAQMVYGLHRIAVTYRGETKTLSKAGESIKISADQDSVTLRYNGLILAVEALQGSVYVNNDVLAKGQTLPDSCVITLGAPELGMRRMFVPIDSSHPGVTT
jgi:eukaryotic-like serine/threonine-protein kinase